MDESGTMGGQGDRGELRPRLAIGSSTLLYWTSYTTLRPLMAPYVASLGARPHLVGFAVGIQAIPGLLMAIPLGYLADRAGARVPIGLGGLGMAAGATMLFALPTLPGVFAAQIVFGAGAIAAWIGIQAGLVAFTRSGGDQRVERVRNISRNSLFMSAGQVVGPTLGGILTDRLGIRAAFGFVMAAAIAIAVSSRLLERHERSSEPDEEPAPELEAEAVAAEPAPAQVVAARRGSDFRTGVGDLARSRGVVVAMLASFLGLFMLDVRTSFHPLYLDSIDFSSTEIGLILSAGAFCMFLARPMLPVLSRVLRDRTIVMLILGVGAWAVCLVVFTSSFATIMVLSLVAGTVLGLSQPFTLSLIANYSPQGRGGLGVGFRMVANRSAHLLSPIVLGALVGLLGFVGGFVSVTVAISLVAIACAVLMHSLQSRASTTQPESGS